MKCFDGLVDLTDVKAADPEERLNFQLTRSLAAYAVHYLSGATPSVSAASVTDAGDDNGIDAIHFDQPGKRLYLVQSKWIKDGIGEPSNGDVKKFLAGVRDIFNMRFDRFNSKVQKKTSILTEALGDPATRYELVLVYTGASSLAQHSRRDLDDIIGEMNDTSEIISCTELNQSALYRSLVNAVAGQPIDLRVCINDWGKMDEPHRAIYGRVSAEDVAIWWTQYRTRLFASNIRSMLGETDVNTEMRQTLEHRPTEFWYFNNGITIVAKDAQRSAEGGSTHQYGFFHCTDISVVNGAQTVGTIGKFAETNPSQLKNAHVQVRIVVRGDDQSFGEEVTRTNNRQNRVEGRDFVALDAEQKRIKSELAVDGIDYQLVRSDSALRGEKGCDLVEATTALACCSGNTRLAVQLKREIGKLWDDIAKAPYREIFNGSISGLFLWRCVQAQRRVDGFIEHFHQRSKATKDKELPYFIHGNRLVALLVLEQLKVKKWHEPAFDYDSDIESQKLSEVVRITLIALIQVIADHYATSVIPTLFKNLNKCEDIVAKVRTGLRSNRGSAS